MTSQPYILSTKTVEFSKSVIAFYKAENPNLITRPIFDQLLRSATSVGANYAEANNSSSRSDFRNKIFLAKKEAAETKYWLNILSGEVSDKTMCSILSKECQEILMILQKIINTIGNRKLVTENSLKTVNRKL